MSLIRAGCMLWLIVLVTLIVGVKRLFGGHFTRQAGHGLEATLPAIPGKAWRTFFRLICILCVDGYGYGRVHVLLVASTVEDSHHHSAECTVGHAR